MVFGLFKKKLPPILTPEMIKPTEALISTSEAKKFYKDWMVKIGHHSNKDRIDKMDLTNHIDYLSEEMKNHEEFLKDEYISDKECFTESINEEKRDLKELRKQFAKCTDSCEKESLLDSILRTENSVTTDTLRLEQSKKRLDDFKRDKRTFLVNYINTEIHGHDWETLIQTQKK